MLQAASRPGVHTPGRSRRWAASGRQPEPLVRPPRLWTPGGSSAGANRPLQWTGPVFGSLPSPQRSGLRSTPSNVWCSWMCRVLSLWRGSRRWSATVAWAKARLKQAVARLLAPFTLRTGHSAAASEAAQERRGGTAAGRSSPRPGQRPRLCRWAVTVPAPPPPRSWRHTCQHSP